MIRRPLASSNNSQSRSPIRSISPVKNKITPPKTLPVPKENELTLESQLADVSRDISKLLDTCLSYRGSRKAEEEEEDNFGSSSGVSIKKVKIETNILHYKLKGDQHVHLAMLSKDEGETTNHFSSGYPSFSSEIETAKASYQTALDLSLSYLSPANMLRLNVILSLANLHYNLLNKYSFAYKTLTQAYTLALSDIQTVKGVNYEDSLRIMQVIRDRISSMINEMIYLTNDKEEEDEDNSLQASHASLPFYPRLNLTATNSSVGSNAETSNAGKAMELVKSLMVTNSLSPFALESFKDSSTIISSLHELFTMYVDKPTSIGYRVSGDMINVSTNNSSSTTNTKGDVVNTESFLDIVSTNEVRMNERGLSKLANDFSISPVLISDEELQVIYVLSKNEEEKPVLERNINSTWSKSGTNNNSEAEGLSYQQFIDALGRCALLAFCVPPYRTQYPQPKDKINGFLVDYLQLLDVSAWRQKISSNEANVAKVSRGVVLSGKTTVDKVEFEMAPQAAKLFSEIRFKKPLTDIFTSYCKREASIGKPLFENMEKFSEQMNQAAFMKLLRDFDVVPVKLSVKEASKLFDVTIAAEAKVYTHSSVPNTFATRLDFSCFLKALGRCAIKAYFDDISSPSHADKVLVFLTSMELLSEQWRNKMKSGGTPHNLNNEGGHRRRTSTAMSKKELEVSSDSLTGLSSPKL